MLRFVTGTGSCDGCGGAALHLHREKGLPAPRASSSTSSPTYGRWPASVPGFHPPHDSSGRALARANSAHLGCGPPGGACIPKQSTRPWATQRPFGGAGEASPARPHVRPHWSLPSVRPAAHRSTRRMRSGRVGGGGAERNVAPTGTGSWRRTCRCPCRIRATTGCRRDSWRLRAWAVMEATGAFCLLGLDLAQQPW